MHSPVSSSRDFRKPKKDTDQNRALTLTRLLLHSDSRETLLEYCRFAEEHDLHLVSDEIYGLSVFDNASCPTALPFTSLLSLDVEKELGISFDRARVHGELSIRSSNSKVQGTEPVFFSLF